ncbi:MAG: PDZ domain-containing protein [Planctomycetota bacterium]
MTEEFDKSDKGKAIIALLERHAPPPPPDVDFARDAVLLKLPSGRRLSIWKWLAPATGAAAAALIAVVMLSTSTPSTTVAPEPTSEVALNTAPEVDSTPVAQPELGLEVRAIRPIENGWLLNRGLAQGLRVGDTLITNGIEIRVEAAGIFRSRGRVLEGKPSRGENLRSLSLTAPMKYARDTRNVGGDAGSFYVFGASLNVLSREEAQESGIEHGTALQVREVFSSIFQPESGENKATPAAKLGLQAGDILLKIDGQPVPDYATFGKVLGWQTEKLWLTARVIRNSAPLELRIR